GGEVSLGGLERLRRGGGAVSGTSRLDPKRVDDEEVDAEVGEDADRDRDDPGPLLDEDAFQQRHCGAPPRPGRVVGGGDGCVPRAGGAAGAVLLPRPPAASDASGCAAGVSAAGVSSGGLLPAAGSAPSSGPGV